MPSRPGVPSWLTGGGAVLRDQGSSLLPVGITDVDGEFAAGDAIEVLCDGEVVGKGIVNYFSRGAGANQGPAVG